MFTPHHVPAGRYALSRSAIGLLSGVLLAAAVPARAQSFPGLQLIYHAEFGDGSLGSGIDPLDIGPMGIGDTGVPGTYPSWEATNGSIRVSITRPSVAITGPVANALYATPIDFGPGTIIGFSGTFVAPAGPHSPTDVWAVAILARTGGVADLPSEIRTVVSFQIRGRAARINMLGGTAPVNSDFLPQAAYDEIFDPVTPQPFTLEFLIDRTTGMAHGKLKLRHTTVSKDILLQDFRADSGPTISAVGAGIAIANAPGQTASVRVLDFKIFGDRSSLARSTIDPCPASFGCRMVPSSQTP